MDHSTRHEPGKPFDLEERTFVFARSVIALTKDVRRHVANVEVMRQLMRAAGSVGANYIEAREALSRKDFFYRIKLCRKEAKESRYWLRLLDIEQGSTDDERERLRHAADELLRIFSSMVNRRK